MVASPQPSDGPKVAPLSYAGPIAQERPRWRDVVSNTLFGAFALVLGTMLLFGGCLAVFLAIARRELALLFTFVFTASIGSVLAAAGAVTLYVVVMRLRGYPPRAIENRVVRWFRVGGNSLRQIGVFGTWRR